MSCLDELVQRISVPDSASPAPEEELPSLQSSTSSSSSDSPVPAKKDKECEARPPKDTPKARKASLPSASSKGVSSGFALPSTNGSRAFQSSPVDYPTSLSPQVSPTLRRSVALPYPSRLPSMRPLTRSTSVSPVRTVLPCKVLLAPSKSLSSALSPHHPSSFNKLNSNSSSSNNNNHSSSSNSSSCSQHQSSASATFGRRPAVTSSSSSSSTPVSHTPSALPRRTPSSSLKRPQPAPIPKQSKASSSSSTISGHSHHNHHNHPHNTQHNNSISTHTTTASSPSSHALTTNTASSTTHSSAHATIPKASPTPRPSLLSPTVSSALKSCAVPLRAVNSLTRSDCEVHGGQPHHHLHHRRSLILSPSVSPSHHQPIAQENKAAPTNKRSSLPERSMKKPIKSSPSPSAALTPTSSSTTATVVRRASGLLDRPKTTASRKSMDLEGLRRKTFTDDMLVC